MGRKGEGGERKGAINRLGHSGTGDCFERSLFAMIVMNVALKLTKYEPR